MNHFPLVSCIVLCYEKDYKFLLKAIESVLSQKYSNIELIISDDGTKDFNYKEIESFIENKKDKNISNIIIRNNEKIGTVKSFNTAIKASNGKYIVILEADDLFYNNLVITNIVAFFISEKCLIATAFRDIYDQNLEKFLRREPIEENLKYFFMEPLELYKKLCVANFISGACTYYDKDFFKLYGYFDEDYYIIEDYPKYLAITRANCKIGLIKLVSIKYRSGGISSSKKSHLYLRDFYKVIEKEITPYKEKIGFLNAEYISSEFIKGLKFYEINYTEKLKQKLNNFLNSFIEIFIREDFIIPESHIKEYLKNNQLISDLVYFSDLKNTDLFLEKILKFDIYKVNKINVLVKILTLYSLRNELKIKYDFLFSMNANLASFWYTNQFSNSTSLNNKIFYERLSNHISKIDWLSDGYISSTLNYPYFLVNYINSDKEKDLKNKINMIIKKNITFNKSSNYINKNKIAIISSSLFQKKSIYKFIFPFFEILSQEYELTLLNIGENIFNNDKNIFNEIINLKIEGKFIDLSKLENSDFALIYYTDIGLNLESIILSNLRIAPIQVTGYGHPVSTCNSEIDYFFISSEIENTKNIEENYAEKTLLLEGLGVSFASIDFSYTNKKRINTPNIITICCPWDSQKINYQSLLNLKEIINKIKKEVIFKFLPSITNRISYLRLKDELENFLGYENIVVFPIKSYQEYLEIIQESDFVIDSYPYGGSNIVIDSLCSKKLFVTIKGTRAYNNFASAILKKVGLEDLITENNIDYINKIVDLIENDYYRTILNEKLTKTNIKEKIVSNKSLIDFKNIITNLIKNLT